MPKWMRGYGQRLANELRAYENDSDVHDLPPIFHYWSNKYLLPKLQMHGIQHPEHFFFLHSEQCLRLLNRPARLLSLGAGNCDMEARLALQLTESGQRDFVVECMDINTKMLERGEAIAKTLGVENHLEIVESDFNTWTPDKQYDVILANQCLHHVVELEHLFDSCEQAMGVESVFLTSDMIGRNGHKRWPEALKLVRQFWKELPM